MPKICDVRANDTDYDGRIVVEQYLYWQGSDPYWAVPAWDECGCPDLCGPFENIGAANLAIAHEFGE